MTWHSTKLETGLRFVPMTGMIIFAAPNAGRLAQRYGSRWPMTIGLTMAGTGLFLMSRITEATPYGVILPVMMVMGLGMGSTMTPMTAAVMNSVGPERAGLGSAMTNTSREVGGVFGIALLGTLLTTQLKSSLSGALAGAGLTASQKAAVLTAAGHGRISPALEGLAPGQAGAVEHAFGGSFLSGFHLALVVAAAVLWAAALIAYRWIPSAPRREIGEPALALAE